MLSVSLLGRVSELWCVIKTSELCPFLSLLCLLKLVCRVAAYDDLILLFVPCIYMCPVVMSQCENNINNINTLMRHFSSHESPRETLKDIVVVGPCYVASVTHPSGNVVNKQYRRSQNTSYYNTRILGWLYNIRYRT